MRLMRTDNPPISAASVSSAGNFYEVISAFRFRTSFAEMAQRQACGRFQQSEWGNFQRRFGVNFPCKITFKVIICCRYGSPDLQGLPVSEEIFSLDCAVQFISRVYRLFLRTPARMQSQTLAGNPSSR
jgi:hypothetical protein